MKIWNKEGRGNYKSCLCDDCKKDLPVVFMLKTEIWRSVDLSTERLCFSCTEKRLGRKITWEDLMSCGASNTMLLGALLHQRNPINIDENILNEL